MQPNKSVEEREECVFCDIKKIASAVIETNGCYIFEPLNPVVKGHRLVVPVFHVADFTEDIEITGNVMKVASDWAYNLGGDFNIITSKGKNATQSVFHFHVHLIPRKEGDGLLLPWTGKEALTSHTNTVLQGVVEMVGKLKQKELEYTKKPSTNTAIRRMMVRRQSRKNTLDEVSSLLNDQIISNKEKK